MYSATEGIESIVCMAKGAVKELVVQRIISCNKAVGGRNGENLPATFDYMNNAGDMARDPIPR